MQNGTGSLKETPCRVVPLFFTVKLTAFKHLHALPLIRRETVFAYCAFQQICSAASSFYPFVYLAPTDKSLNPGNKITTPLRRIIHYSRNRPARADIAVNFLNFYTVYHINMKKSSILRVCFFACFTEGFNALQAGDHQVEPDRDKHAHRPADAPGPTNAGKAPADAR